MLKRAVKITVKVVQGFSAELL